MSKVGDKGYVPPSSSGDLNVEKSRIKSISKQTHDFSGLFKKTVEGEHPVSKIDIFKQRKVTEGPIKGTVKTHESLPPDVQKLITNIEQRFIDTKFQSETRFSSRADDVLKGFNRVEDGDGYILSSKTINSFDQFATSRPSEKIPCFCSMYPEKRQMQMWVKKAEVQELHDIVQKEEIISLMKEKNVTNVIVHYIDDEVWENEVEPIIIERMAEKEKSLSNEVKSDVIAGGSPERIVSQRPQIHHDHKRGHKVSETSRGRENRKEDIREHQRKGEERAYQKKHERLKEQQIIDREDEKRRVSQQKHEKDNHMRKKI